MKNLMAQIRETIRQVRESIKITFKQVLKGGVWTLKRVVEVVPALVAAPVAAAGAVLDSMPSIGGRYFGLGKGKKGNVPDPSEAGSGKADKSEARQDGRAEEAQRFETDRPTPQFQTAASVRNVARAMLAGHSVDRFAGVPRAAKDWLNSLSPEAVKQLAGAKLVDINSRLHGKDVPGLDKVPVPGQPNDEAPASVSEAAKRRPAPTYEDAAAIRTAARAKEGGFYNARMVPTAARAWFERLKPEAIEQLSKARVSDVHARLSGGGVAGLDRVPLPGRARTGAVGAAVAAGKVVVLPTREQREAMVERVRVDALAGRVENVEAMSQRAFAANIAAAEAARAPAPPPAAGKRKRKKSHTMSSALEQVLEPVESANHRMAM